MTTKKSRKQVFRRTKFPSRRTRTPISGTKGHCSTLKLYLKSAFSLFCLGGNPTCTDTLGEWARCATITLSREFSTLLYSAEKDGIRTHGTVLKYFGLAGHCLKPLGHLLRNQTGLFANRLELLLQSRNRILNPTCLPIPPSVFFVWPVWELNPYLRRERALS